MLYICNTEAYTEEMLKKQLPEFPAWRRDKIEKLKSPAAQKNAAMAFLLLQYALSREFGIVPTAFTYNAHGKPYLPGNAAYFSMSHCAGAVACFVDRQEVGVDIERILPVREKVVFRKLGEKARAEIEAAASPDEAFTRLWTEKEAIAKFEGRGLSMPFQTIQSEAYLLTTQVLSPFVVTACYGNSGEKRVPPTFETVPLTTLL